MTKTASSEIAQSVPVQTKRDLSHHSDCMWKIMMKEKSSDKNKDLHCSISYMTNTLNITHTHIYSQF